MYRQFVKCESELHAETVDGLILARLQDEFGSQASCWSGIWAKSGLLGNTYGVYWGSPVSDIFGFPPSEEHPDGDPAVKILTEKVDAEGNSDWSLVLPEVIPSEAIL